MSISSGIAPFFGQLKAAGRKKGIADVLDDISSRSRPFIDKTSADLKKWGQEDWDKFKETHRPVSDSLVADANRAPDNARYEKEATLGAARGVSDANTAIASDASRSGSGPNSGRFLSSTVAAASAGGRAGGIGQARARRFASQESTDKKLSVMDLGRNDPSAAIAGLGLVVKGGREYGKYSGAIGAAAADNLGGAGKGIGQAIGGYKGGKNYNSPDNDKSGQPDYVWGNKSGADDANSQNAAFGDDYSGQSFADGGVIRGPGTGRSDSIPAVIDGRAPARVSDGEYLIKNNVAAAIGRQRLNALLSIAKGA